MLYEFLALHRVHNYNPERNSFYYDTNGVIIEAVTFGIVIMDPVKCKKFVKHFHSLFIF